MKAPSEEVLTAIIRMSMDTQYPKLVEWISGLYDESREAVVDIDIDVKYRQEQGKAKALRHLREVFANPREKLKQLREGKEKGQAPDGMY